tara:strand:+ start:2806 stop:3549 length:744 start_codon:yes stop_codon:yes gene_type:complete
MASLKLNINTVSSNAVITSDTVDIVNWKAGQITGTSSNVITAGTATETTANKLIDTSENFNSSTAQVLVGDTVSNITDTTTATVTAIDSDTVLSLSANIMAIGDEYSIIPPSTVVYSAPPSDFGVNTYFTPDMAGSIVVNTTDSTKATVVEVINSNRIKISSTILDTKAKAFTVYSPSSNYPGYALYVSTSASISTLPATYVSFKVLTVDGDTTTFTNFPIGTVLPVQVKRVFTTGLAGSPVFVAIV